MIDIYHKSPSKNDGYRPNVGLILLNQRSEVLWGRRISQDGWQFPQGGVEPSERLIDAAFRELYEEVGLHPNQVSLKGTTQQWLRYDLPGRIKARQFRRANQIRGQKQIWFMFQFLGCDEDVCLNASKQPEFDQWMWLDYWKPIEQIVYFKRSVYERALMELEPLLKINSNQESLLSHIDDSNK